MIDLGKQWPLNISFFADKCKCLDIANLVATEPFNPAHVVHFDRLFHTSTHIQLLAVISKLEQTSEYYSK